MFLELAAIFLSIAAVVFLAGLRRRGSRWRRDLASAAVALSIMLVLTAIFDNLMIAAGLFDYGEHTLSGLRIGMAPVEDFLYAACGVLFMSGLWWLMAGTSSKQTPSKPENR
ncbi:lycopene cyclase [Glutamicibacter uratoxydans]|uniref:Lycopene cyclase n=1 Tax=Glutamicibacter uratoxydans TaxID=43667 RepID=A0A4Y4DLN2_GLUUR|nr:lycopene cyclase domain-containing protein [Glutamicibacter uratoxydans]GED06232.1 lycopene cyclase [Glutamicibacter uratoxydans]